MIGTESSFSSKPILQGSSTSNFFLHHQKQFLWNDGFMISLDVVLGDDTSVFHPLFLKIIYGIGLLQEGIPHVLFVFKNQTYACIIPFGFASWCQNPITFQPLCNLLTAFSFKIFSEDTLDNLCLFRIDNQMPIFIFVIAKKASGIDHYFSLLKTILYTNFYVLAERFRFLLCQWCHNGK